VDGCEAAACNNHESNRRDDGKIRKTRNDDGELK
jgi:hypothetical protein